MPDKTATPPATGTTDEQAQVGRPWVDKLGRVRTPRAYYYEHDDGKPVVGPEAIAAMNEAWGAGEFCGLQRAVGRTQPRARGAGRPKVRGASRRSSARSGDSGEDGESSDAEPPRRRFCTYFCCGRDISHKRPHALYCSDGCRKRAQRARDRLEPERVPERRLVLLAKDEAPPPVRCKCDPKGHLVDENVCVPCGRARGNGEVAWLTEARDLRSKQLVARAPARRNPRYGDRKRKPVREWVDETIVRRVAA